MCSEPTNNVPLLGNDAFVKLSIVIVPPFAGLVAVIAPLSFASEPVYVVVWPCALTPMVKVVAVLAV